MPIQRLLDRSTNPPVPEDLYRVLLWPDPPARRPYTYINMASTTDGKVVLGSAAGTAKGVGGPTDQILFRRLQGCCDGVLLGGVTLRASEVIYAPHVPRYTVTRSGDVPLTNRFFTDAPGRAWVFAPHSLSSTVAENIRTVAKLVQIGDTEVDLSDALTYLRRELGIRSLLCEGGPSINDQLFRAGLVDQLFLTLSNKIKGGASLPTIVTGNGFDPGEYQPLSLISVYQDADELYLRYQVGE